MTPFSTVVAPSVEAFLTLALGLPIVVKGIQLVGLGVRVLLVVLEPGIGPREVVHLHWGGSAKVYTCFHIVQDHGLDLLVRLLLVEARHDAFCDVGRQHFDQDGLE